MPKFQNSKRVIITVSIPHEKAHILNRFNQLVRVERLRGGRSELVVRAMKEYIDHHWPGNPQQTFQLPSPSLDPHRDRAAINFLRFQVKLPIRQICKIVRRSTGYVLEACHSPTGFRGITIEKKMLKIYRKRFEGWMAGRYESLKEAFRLA